MLCFLSICKHHSTDVLLHENKKCIYPCTVVWMGFRSISLWWHLKCTTTSAQPNSASLWFHIIPFPTADKEIWWSCRNNRRCSFRFSKHRKRQNLILSQKRKKTGRRQPARKEFFEVQTKTWHYLLNLDRTRLYQCLLPDRKQTRITVSVRLQFIIWL